MTGPFKEALTNMAESIRKATGGPDDPERLRGVKPCFRFKVGGPATTNRLRGATQASRGRGLFPVAPRHHVVDRAGKLDLREERKGPPTL